MLKLSREQLRERLKKIRNPLDMNRKIRRGYRTDKMKDEALKLVYQYECSKLDIELNILKLAFNFLYNVVTDEEAHYHITQARNRIFELNNLN